MKIEYQNKIHIFKKIKIYNLAYGLMWQKRKLKRKENTKVKTYFYQLVDLYLFIFTLTLFIPVIDSNHGLWINVDAIYYGLIIFLIFNFLLKHIFRKKTKEELTISKKSKSVSTITKETITDSFKNGKIISKNWNEVELMYINNEFIIIICNKKASFYYENENKLSEKLKEFIHTNNINIPIIENRKKKSFLLLILKHILIFFIFFCLLIFIAIKRNDVLNREIDEIKFHQNVINENIESVGDNSKIEKVAKEFLKQYFEKKEEYLKINPLNFFENYKITDLLLRKKKIVEYYNHLSEHKEESLKKIEEIESLLKEEEIKKYAKEKEIEDWNIEKFFQKIIYVLENDINYSWEEEKNKINEKTKYLEKLLYLLIKEDADWIIEEDKIYFAKEEDYQEYLENFNLFHDFPLKDNHEVI